MPRRACRATEDRVSSPQRPVGWLESPPGARWPTGSEDLDADPNPFVRYRSILWSHHRAMEAGLDDEAFVEIVRRLDDAVAEVDGTGFRDTPLVDLAEVGSAFGHTGRLLGKDETGNVSGTHKARHLFGLALHLEVDGVSAETPLVIASCGNAALAAAVVARAAGRPLTIHVPVWADPAVLAMLDDLGATAKTCERHDGEVGDPCVLRARELVADGAIPFTCQGTENLMTIDGGRTIGFELATGLMESATTCDHLFIQVGGGALASSAIQALTEAADLGVLASRPKLHAVQSEGCAPLARAFRLVQQLDDPLAALTIPGDSSFMWPWDDPGSLATGILDDVVYDWQPIVTTMLESGGSPVVSTEAEVAEAHRLVHDHTGVPADPTGTAGLAGLLTARRHGMVDDDDTVVVLLTGVER